MTATLPAEVREAFGRFVTCEYTTIDSRGQPIVWPVTPYYSDGGETIDITTGLGYPKKAEDARRNPRVSLLFSDPTGSGIESGIRALVQGVAEVDDADLAANRERYWGESWEKLPGARKLHPPKPLRGLFNWYYTRIYVKVRPERVFVWPEGDQTRPPTLLDSHKEEVRSGHVEEPLEPQAPPAGGGRAWDERIEELRRRYHTAVLAWAAPDGFPLSVRVPVAPDRETGRIGLGPGPAGFPLTEGRASLVAHSHPEDFSWQENFQLRGDLVQEGESWALIPHRLIGGFELPNESAAARYRRNLSKSIRFWRTARRELKRRSA